MKKLLLSAVLLFSLDAFAAEEQKHYEQAMLTAKTKQPYVSRYAQSPAGQQLAAETAKAIAEAEIARHQADLLRKSNSSARESQYIRDDDTQETDTAKTKQPYVSRYAQSPAGQQLAAKTAKAIAEAEIARHQADLLRKQNQN